ncbi:MAG: hypothetical protein LUE31_01305 [Lachnospiraceae bacterium]|nr:hypothetical protein [Lachnospiraceae bacterium]
MKDLNTELSKKEKNIRDLKNRRPFSAPVETRVEYKTEYIHKDKCVNCQINSITSKYKNLCRKSIYLVVYTVIMMFIAIMKNSVLKCDIVTFVQTTKNGIVSFVCGVFEMCFSCGEQIMTATVSNSRALYWITSILFLLLVIGFIGGILFYLMKNLILFFRTFWNFTQTAVTIIIFSLLICFADVLDIKGSLKLNLIVLFMIADMAVMVIRAVYDCIKNW